MTEEEMVKVCKDALLSGNGMISTLVEMHGVSIEEAEAVIGKHLDEIFDMVGIGG